MKSTLFVSMLSLLFVSTIAFSGEEPGPVIPQQTPPAQQETLLQKFNSWLGQGKAMLEKAQTAVQTLNQTGGDKSSVLNTVAGLFSGSQTTPPTAAE